MHHAAPRFVAVHVFNDQHTGELDVEQRDDVGVERDADAQLFGAEAMRSRAMRNTHGTDAVIGWSNSCASTVLCSARCATDQQHQYQYNLLSHVHSR